jgi:hypothetical protein
VNLEPQNPRTSEPQNLRTSEPQNLRTTSSVANSRSRRSCQDSRSPRR